MKGFRVLGRCRVQGLGFRACSGAQRFVISVCVAEKLVDAYVKGGSSGDFLASMDAEGP